MSDVHCPPTTLHEYTEGNNALGGILKHRRQVHDAIFKKLETKNFIETKSCVCVFYLFDDCDLSQVSSGAALYQRNISCQTHPVYMVTSRYRDKSCVTFLIICTLN